MRAATGRWQVVARLDHPSPAAAPGMGLRIMRYRASLFGGALQIARRTEGGMRVACTFPVKI